MTRWFTAGGHLTDLALEEYVAGGLASESVAQHLASCTICQRRLEAIRAHEESFSLVAPRFPDPQSNRRAPYGLILSMAAAVLIFWFLGSHLGVQSEYVESVETPWVEPSEYFRVKGGLNVEVFVNRGGLITRAQESQVVYPGDKIGFQVSTPVAGYLMIIGQDKLGDPYLCYPQREKGKSKPFGPTEGMSTLDEAIVLDDVLGDERITAIFCGDPFELSAVSTGLLTAEAVGARAAMPHSDCRVRRITLRKKRTTP